MAGFSAKPAIFINLFAVLWLASSIFTNWRNEFSIPTHGQIPHSRLHFQYAKAIRLWLL